MKRFLTMVLTAVFVLAISASVFAGGTEEDSGEETIKIGFLVKLAECSWFQDEWKFARQAAEEYGFELIEMSTPDGEKVLSAIDNLSAQGAQGFVICTPDVKLGPSIKMKADQYGMKLISVDLCIRDRQTRGQSGGGRSPEARMGSEQNRRGLPDLQ